MREIYHLDYQGKLYWQQKKNTKKCITENTWFAYVAVIGGNIPKNFHQVHRYERELLSVIITVKTNDSGRDTISMTELEYIIGDRDIIYWWIHMEYVQLVRLKKYSTKVLFVEVIELSYSFILHKYVFFHFYHHVYVFYNRCIETEDIFVCR